MMVYGRLPRGPLAVLKENWCGLRDAPLNLGQSTAEYLKDLRTNLEVATAETANVAPQIKTGDCLPQEFCGLRSKMYSLLTPSTDTSLSFVKAKGVPKSYVKKNVRHEQYLHVLNTWRSTKCKFRSFRYKRHVLRRAR